MQVAGETEVKALIKLRFRTYREEPIVVIRTFQVCKPWKPICQSEEPANACQPHSTCSQAIHGDARQDHHSQCKLCWRPTIFLIQDAHPSCCSCKSSSKQMSSWRRSSGQLSCFQHWLHVQHCRMQHTSKQLALYCEFWPHTQQCLSHAAYTKEAGSAIQSPGQHSADIQQRDRCQGSLGLPMRRY